MKKSIALHKDDLLKLGVEENNSKETADLVNNHILKKSRINKYCPSLMFDFTNEFEKAATLNDRKLIFKGIFVNQEKIGVGTMDVYNVRFRNEADSICNFLSTYPMDIEEIEGKKVSLVYHMQIDSSIWIDSVIIKL